MTLSAADARELDRALDVLEQVIRVRLEQRRPLSTTPDALARALEVAARAEPKEGAAERLPAADAFAGDGPLAELLRTYELSPKEALVLVAALAPEIDEKFDAYYAALTDRPGTSHLTGEVARNLLARNLGARLEVDRMLSPSARLRAHGMLILEPSDLAPLAGRVRIEPDLARWLTGQSDDRAAADPRLPARRLHTVHDLDSMVLTADVDRRLREIVARIRNRGKVLGRYGFARLHDNAGGLAALFAGPPGTGKTMAAAAIGRAVERPVYRVDLSLLVSKYIGETEKNLSLVFDRAESRGWLLFFDEADAVFGKRTEVHEARDRYANQEISYLLQRVEAFDGVMILATNLVENLDRALARRLHAIVAFGEPGEHERRRLWRAVLPDEQSLTRAEDVDLDRLAHDYEMTGGEIRNAAFHAAYLSAVGEDGLRQEHLIAGVRAEYEKSGRRLPVHAR